MGSKLARGWNGEESITPTGSSWGPARGAGRAATCWVDKAGGCSGATSISRSNALSPLPSAFLVMVQDLLRELRVGHGAAGIGFVQKNRFAVAGGFGQPDAAGDDGAED